MLIEAGKHYGEGIIKKYSKRLTNDLGKGYTETNLKYFRQFYMFSKCHTVCDDLSWSHYRTLLSISNKMPSIPLFLSSSNSLMIRIPLPPPPAEALIITGNPISFAVLRASS